MRRRSTCPVGRRKALPAFRGGAGRRGRRGRRPVVRWPGREPRRRRARRPLRGPRPVLLPAPPARLAGARRGSSTGRGSAAPSCCSRASPTRSRGSASCGTPCATCPTPSSSRIRSWGTRSSRSSTTRSIGSRRSARACPARITAQSSQHRLAGRGRCRYLPAPSTRRARVPRTRPSPSRRVNQGRLRRPLPARRSTTGALNAPEEGGAALPHRSRRSVAVSVAVLAAILSRRSRRLPAPGRMPRRSIDSCTPSVRSSPGASTPRGTGSPAHTAGTRSCR